MPNCLYSTWAPSEAKKGQWNQSLKNYGRLLQSFVFLGHFITFQFNILFKLNDTLIVAPVQYLYFSFTSYIDFNTDYLLQS